MKRERTIKLIGKHFINGLSYILVVGFLLTFTACEEDDSGDPEPEEETAGPEAAFLGSWSIANEAGALAVGPSAGSSEWWALPADALADRSCQLDDTYTFAEGGVFTIDLGSETWLEGWQGVEAEGCGAGVAPHVSGDYGFSVSDDGSQLTITGSGAFIALAKVNNDGELGTDNAPSSIPTSITFDVVSISETTMNLQIEVGTGVFWAFKLTAN